MALKVSLDQQKRVLTDNRDFIVKHLDPDDVIDELIQNHLIGKMLHKRSLNQWVGVEKKRTESSLIN